MTLAELTALRARLVGLSPTEDAPVISVDELRELLDIADDTLRRREDMTTQMKVRRP